MQRTLTIALAILVTLVMSAQLSFAVEKSGCSGCDLAAKQGKLMLYSVSLSAAESEASAQDDGEDRAIFDKSNIRIINLGPVVNSDVLDYAPTVSADGRTLFFVSNREGSKLLGESDDQYSHDFWKTSKAERLDTIFSPPINIDTTTIHGDMGINTHGNEGVASIAADRQTLYFTACDRKDGWGSCDIYKTVIEGDHWGRPTNLGSNVNSLSYDTQPSISPDQSRIYFVSTREGPNSDGDLDPVNYDIWYSDYDFDMEEWLPAKNLEALNTEGSECSPFIAADNQTLFFASDGHPGSIGGLDFYYSKYNFSTESWDKPVNLGEPLNTPDREQFISLPASGDIIYFSSSRTDLDGYQGSLDVFMAFVPTFFRAVTLTGTVVDECSRENIPAVIKITNSITGRVIVDSLTTLKTQFQIVIFNTDYGPEDEGHEYVDLEISASNAKYGETSITKRIKKPAKTENVDQAGTSAYEEKVELTLGQIPILSTDIEEAKYITENKGFNPELAGYNGLVMEEVKTWSIYPLLTYVFFDLGQSDIPDRYILFDEPDETEDFDDVHIAGGTLDKYYHILNIIGYRMKNNPGTKIELIGTKDNKEKEEKDMKLSQTRADNVFNYLTKIWQIDPARIKVKAVAKPKHPSNMRDSLGIRENRRVEIICDEWEIWKPVFEKSDKTFPEPEFMDFVLKNGIEDELVADRRIEILRNGQTWKVLNEVGLTDKKKKWDWMNDAGKYPTDEAEYVCQLVVKTQTGAECKSEPIEINTMQVSLEKKSTKNNQDSTLEKYSLILFPFNSSDPGSKNNRIMNDYVYNRCLPESNVKVVGHTDVVGLNDHNKRLSERRAKSVYDGIMKKTKRKIAQITTEGVGEDNPLYENDLPEKRFYNRTVMVEIHTPLSAWARVEQEQQQGE